MINSQIIISDGVDNHTYDLIGRTGMNSIRSEIAAGSAEAARLRIDNKLDINDPNSRNRHQISFSYNEVVEGMICGTSVYTVINRHKLGSDALLLQKWSQLSALMNKAGVLDAILVGGN